MTLHKKKSLIPGILFYGLSLFLGITLLASRESLEIMLWTYGFRRLILAATILPAIAGTCFTAPAVVAIARTKEKKVPLLPSDSRFSRAFLTRANTRDQLIEIQVKRPKLAGDIDQCLEQLSAVGRLLDRFEVLVKTNGIAAKPIEGAKDALKAIEETLCVNFRWVINLSIAADEDGHPATDRFYDQCRQRIQHALYANRTALNKGGDFLIALADNISQVAKQINSDRHSSLIDAWIKTIEEQNEQSTITFKEEQL